MSYLNYIKEFKKYIESNPNPNDKMIFNKDLEEVTEFDKISWIIVGDNPGKTESENHQYFSKGYAAKGLTRVFDEKLKLKKNKEYICLNKTPIYSSRTNELCKVDQTLLKDSFIIMAKLIFDLHKLNSKIKVLIVGFSSKEIKPFFSELKEQYKKDKDLINKVYVAGHFSYGWFERMVDINQIKDEESFVTQLKKVDQMIM